MAFIKMSSTVRRPIENLDSEKGFGIPILYISFCVIQNVLKTNIFNKNYGIFVGKDIVFIKYKKLN